MDTQPPTEFPAGWELLFQHGVFPPRYQTLAAPNESVVAWADTLPAGCSVLDVGCGVGRHVVYLGERGFKMAGMDVSPTGIQQTQAVCAERLIAFDGRVADMLALPWEEATFDAVLSTSTLSHNRVADIQTSIDEIHRVLKPGGLFLADFPHRETLAYQRVREQTASGKISEIEPYTFMDETPQFDRTDDAFLPHHFADEAGVRQFLHAFQILKLWAELPQGSQSQRGYWVVWAQKS